MHNAKIAMDEMSPGAMGSPRNLLQVDEFPGGQSSVVEYQAFPTPTVTENLSSKNETTRQYGTGGIPFTTSGAYSEIQDFSQSGDPIIVLQEPTNLLPWSATGKLVLSSGTTHV